MKNAFNLARKDLLRSIRDRSVIAVAIVAPLALAFILSAVLPDDELDITYAFVDEDGGPIAQAFAGGVLASVGDGFAAIERAESRAVAVELAEEGEIAAAFVFPGGLSDSVQAGRPAEIEVVSSPDSDIGASIARSIAEGYAAQLNAIGLSVATAVAQSGEPPTPAMIARISSEAQAIEPPLTVSDQDAGNREFDDKTFFAAGMAVFFLFFTTQLGAQSLLRERREGTLARLIAAPMSRAAIVGGKALFTFIVGVVSLAVLIVASDVFLGARWGDPIGVALMVLAGVFAAMGVQSVVTSLAKTDDQAASYGSIIAVTLGLLGGTFFPLSQAPGVVATLSYATPHAWIMRGLGDLSGGATSLGDIALPLSALVVFGVVTGAVGLIGARRLVAAR